MSLFHSTADWWKELAPGLTTINDEPKRMEVSNVVQRQRHSTSQPGELRNALETLNRLEKSIEDNTDRSIK